jgi:predicted  nucleic acid-binding Zn-ribbon protein
VTHACDICGESFESDNPQRRKCDTCRSNKVSPEVLQAKRAMTRYGQRTIRQSHSARQ